MYEDNKAVLEMIRSDGPFSLRTRHLSIKLFFVKQFVDKKEVMVKFCRTEAMVADMLTKALVGSTFRRLRDILMQQIGECKR